MAWLSMANWRRVSSSCTLLGGPPPARAAHATGGVAPDVTSASTPTVVAAAARGGHQQQAQHEGDPGTGTGHRHPFTAPEVRPRTSWRWNRTRSTKIGAPAITVPASTTLIWSTLVAARALRPI